MQVNNVLVDNISWADTDNEAVAKSTLYEFREPRWISVHWERQGRRVGPLTVVTDYEDDVSKLDRFSVQEFPERRLRSAISRGVVSVSYRERWTIPPWTAYAIVLPVGFVPVAVTAKNEQGYDVCPELRIASSPLGFIFYETVFLGTDGQHFVDLRADIRKDPAEFAKLLEKPEVVEGQKRFESLRSRVTREALSPDFWFKLLDLARSVIQGK